MPRYVLVAKFDSGDDIKTLHDDKDTLSVDTTILDAEDEKKEVSIALSKTSDIVSSTVLTWNDSFQIQSKDSSGTSKWFDISYGQTFSDKAQGQTVETTTDAPGDGFLIKLDSIKTIKIQQKFNDSSTWTVIDSKKYEKGATELIPMLKVKVTLKKASVDLDFTQNFSQVIYYDPNDAWTLVGPDSYGIGSYLTTVQGADSYVISQQISRDLTMAYTALSSTSGVTAKNTLKMEDKQARAPGYSGLARRLAADGGGNGSDSKDGLKKYDFPVGPVKLVLYVDLKNFGAYVSANVFGHSFGTLGGDLNKGITYHVDLLAFSGTIKLYLLTNEQTDKKKNIIVEVKLEVIGSTPVDLKKTIAII